MHCLTNEGNWELQIDYQLSNGTKSYLHYKQFAIGVADDKYQLTISGFDRDGLTDPFRGINRLLFSSRDQDNDFLSTGVCSMYHGGWWHNSCSYIILNT